MYHLVIKHVNAKSLSFRWCIFSIETCMYKRCSIVTFDYWMVTISLSWFSGFPMIQWFYICAVPLVQTHTHTIIYVYIYIYIYVRVYNYICIYTYTYITCDMCHGQIWHAGYNHAANTWYTICKRRYPLAICYPVLWMKQQNKQWVYNGVMNVGWSLMGLKAFWWKQKATSSIWGWTVFDQLDTYL